MQLMRSRTAALSIATGLLGLGLCFFSLFVPGAHSQPLRGSWRQVDIGDLVPPAVRLSHVQLVDNTTAWLVGSEKVGNSSPLQGRVYKLEWENGNWAVSERYGFTETINHLNVAPDGNVRLVATGYVRGVCCGTYDRILRRDAIASRDGWQEETEQLKGIFINSILMLPSRQEGWAGGGIEIQGCKFTCSRSYLLRYTNGSWITDTTPSLTGRSIASMDFTTGIGYPDDYLVGYAVGESIARYDGQSWAKVSLPPLPPGPTVTPDKQSCPGLYFACLSFNKVRVLGPDESWILGKRYPTLSDSDAEPVLLHLSGGRWQVVMPGNAILQTRPAGTQPLKVTDFSMGDAGYGFLAASPIQIAGDRAYAQIIQVRPDGSLSYEQIPQIDHTELSSISNTDANHALAVGEQSIQVPTETGLTNRLTAVLLAYGYDDIREGQTLTPTPATPAASAASSTPTQTSLPSPTPPGRPTSDKHYRDGIYFPNVGHNLRGGFLKFWQEHGGLAQFGYPLTEEFTEKSLTDGKSYTVQYFERAEFEYHPENKPPHDVLLSLLGAMEYRARYPGGAPQQKPNNSAGSVYFPQTGKRVGGSFLTYWQQFGGVQQQGYPVSDELQEQSKLDGKTYTVQYFERAVMEWHPGATPPDDVQLSLLGVFRYREMYGGGGEAKGNLPF